MVSAKSLAIVDGVSGTDLAAWHLRDGIDAKFLRFGSGSMVGRAVNERTVAISIKINDEIAQMRSEANTNRDTLRALIERIGAPGVAASATGCADSGDNC